MADFDLHELLAAPILAMNEAEAQNSARYVELLEEYAFEPAKAGGIRKLSTLSFSYMRAEPDGTAQLQNVEIPLVQFLPISGVSIETAKLNYALKINPSTEKASGRLKMLGRLAETVESNTPLSGNLNIEIQLKQVDMPQGVMSLLQASSSGVREVPMPKEEPAPPVDVPVELPDKFIDFEVLEKSAKVIAPGQDYATVIRPSFVEGLKKYDAKVSLTLSSHPKGALSFEGQDKQVINDREDFKIKFLTSPRIDEYKASTKVKLLILVSAEIDGKEAAQFTHSIVLQRRISRKRPEKIITKKPRKVIK